MFRFRNTFNYLLAPALLAAATAASAHTGAGAHLHAGDGAMQALMAGLSHPIAGLDHLLAMVALGLWWLIREIPERWRVRRFSFGQDGSVDDGVTDVTTDALAGAVADDVASLPDVARATVRFFGARAEPEMLVRIDVADGADVGALRAGLERDVLPDLERSLGARLAHVGVQIRTGARIEGQSEFVPTAVDHHLL